MDLVRELQSELLEHWYSQSAGRCSCGERLGKNVNPELLARHVAERQAERLFSSERLLVAPRCESRYPVPVLGSVRCLLTAAHGPHRHYAAWPDDQRRFWTWDDVEQEVAS